MARARRRQRKTRRKKTRQAPKRRIRVTVLPPKTDGPEPEVWRAPELLHGLGNIIENAGGPACINNRPARCDGVLGP